MLNVGPSWNSGLLKHKKYIWFTLQNRQVSNSAIKDGQQSSHFAQKLTSIDKFSLFVNNRGHL